MMNQYETFRDAVDAVRSEVFKIFAGRDDPMDLLVTGFFAGLPVLIEDIPGVGKTTLARGLAAACSLDFGRIQFTPDLLPGDVTGMTIWSQEARDFVFKPGSVMHNFVLADEINRAPARTQAALLEAMQEGAVTVDGVTHRRPEPFFLVATQNPLNYAGTFQLPEAQLDRFGISFSIGYPERDQEIRIVGETGRADSFTGINPVLQAQEITAARETVDRVLVSDRVMHYIVDLLEATRRSGNLRIGASPRAGQHLARTARARAFMDGRDFVLPEDVRSIVNAVLAHRVSLAPDVRLAGRGVQEVLAEIVDPIPMPSGLE